MEPDSQTGAEPATAKGNLAELTVSELSLALKRTVEDRFGLVRVRGEITGFRGAHSSGHCYFALKDDRARLEAVIWKGSFARLRPKLQEGLEVVATGKLTTFPGTSKYQIVVESVEPAGVGALMALLEKRRKALEAEGLFDPKRKKKLPFLPRVIGVITSPTGAVIRDILHRIEDRFPLHIIVWPVAVQGEGAAEQIAEAINGFNSLNPESRIPNPDLLIVARGGGSIEDLWAFNEEIVVRAAAASRIPLISAVGHETDTTLIDFASDQRAPTPTAAAEMAVPVRAELLQNVHELQARLGQVSQRLFETATQKLDDWSERLAASLPLMLARKEQQLAVLAAKLQPRVLISEMGAMMNRLLDAQKRMQLSCARLIEKREQQLSHLAALLESVNYKRILDRGFALVKDAGGKLVTSAKQAAMHKELELTFKDGKMRVGKGG